MSSREKKNKHTGQTSPDNIYVNRELSWLEFNRRVLLEAADPQVPLLERLKFLMIYQSNLEEFYRVRIGILTHRDLLAPEDLAAMWKELSALGVRRWFLQQFNPVEVLADGLEKRETYADSELAKIARSLDPAGNVRVRGLHGREIQFDARQHAEL